MRDASFLKMGDVGMAQIDTRDLFVKHDIPEPEVQHASFGARFGAYVIDLFVFMTVCFIPYLLLNTPFSLGIFFGMSVVVYLLKDSIKGQSLGKFIFGLSVRGRDSAEEYPSFARRILRNLTLSRLTETRVWRVKKRSMWIIILAFVLALALPFAIMIFAPNRSPLTAEEFTQRMEAEGFVVEDVLHTVELEGGSYYLRVHQTGVFFMEFAVFFSDSAAQRAYSGLVFDVQRAAAGMSTATTQMGFANYNRFTLTAGGEYFVVSRIGNTVLFAQTSTGNRAPMNELLRELGY